MPRQPSLLKHLSTANGNCTSSSALRNMWCVMSRADYSIPTMWGAADVRVLPATGRAVCIGAWRPTAVRSSGTGLLQQGARHAWPPAGPRAPSKAPEDARLQWWDAERGHWRDPVTNQAQERLAEAVGAMRLFLGMCCRRRTWTASRVTGTATGLPMAASKSSMAF